MFPASTYDHSQHFGISRQPGNSNPVKVLVSRFLRKFLAISAAFHPVISASPKIADLCPRLAGILLQHADHQVPTHENHSHESRDGLACFQPWSGVMYKWLPQRAGSSGHSRVVPLCLSQRRLAPAPSTPQQRTAEKNRPIAPLEWPGPPLHPHNSIRANNSETALSRVRINRTKPVEVPWRTGNRPVLLQ